MKLNSLLINLTAAIFVIYGFGFIFQPQELATLVTGEAPSTGTAMADMRASYGGMSVAIGVILFALSAKAHLQPLGLIAVVIAMLSMAFGRTVGLTIDRPVNSIMYYYLAMEIAAAAAALILLFLGRKS